MKSPHSAAIELLEPRIAPASVAINIAAKTATWTDYDGDLVTMKWTSASPLVFTSHDDGLGVTVDRIDVTVGSQNAGVTLTVKALSGGDGYVDIGRLSAAGVALKSLNAPKASFSEIDAGDGTKGISALSLHSLGTIPVNSFAGTSGDGHSLLSGVFTSFKLAGDFGSGKLTLGKAGEASGSIAIGGSIRGDTVSSFSASNGQLIFNGSKLASFTLGGSLIGGNADFDGSVQLNATVSTVTILGSLLGGEANTTGKLEVSTAGTLKIAGSIVGGSGISSGSVNSYKVATFTLGGSIVGGTKDYAGFASLGQLGKATVTGDIHGGSSYLSGLLTADQAKSFTMTGSLYGGTAGNTGLISLGTTGSFVLKGGIFGNEATAASTAGSVAAVRLTDASTVSILGGIHAGRAASGTVLPYNGALFLEGNTGTVTIKGGLTGNSEMKAYLLAEGVAVHPGDYAAIKSLSITGDVSLATIATGHTADFAAAVGNAENPDAGLGSLTVTGSWLHSSLLVGVNDTSDNGANSSDTRTASDVSRLARVGLVKITGRVLDDPTATGYSGFIAEKIAQITVGGTTVFKTGNPTRYLDTSGYVIVREL